MRVKRCEHLEGLEIKPSGKYECEECIKTGDQWVHLRTCQSCGVTLCCDSSPNQHAQKHYKSYGHTVISSAEPGEKWVYCFADDLFTRYE